MAVHWFQRAFKRIIQKRMVEMLASRSYTLNHEPMHLLLSENDERSVAKRLVAEMTLEEKISLLSGFEEFCIPGVERLGLKPVWTSDATLGLRGWKATVTDFPASVALAATFDNELLKQVGSVMGYECRALGVGVLLGPGVNIARVPVNGRNFEYFGEDPYLASEMAVHYIAGVKQYPVITTVKHFACNNSEYDRHKSNSEVDERSLRELYLPAFKRAIEAGSLGIMTSYNQVNGTYTSEHPYLIEGVLRGEWGFDGLVVSDWNSLYSTDGALKHGVDLEMPQAKYFTKERVLDALRRNVVVEEDLDAKVLHLLTSYEKAGLFTAPMADPCCKVGSPESRAIALKAALAAPVLLKNERQALPLSASMKLCIGGSNAFRVAQGGGSSMIQHESEPETFAQRMQGSGATLLSARWYAHAKEKQRVRACDAVVLVVGFDHIEESEAYDRPWTLSASDRKAIDMAVKLNKRTIVVVQSGCALEMESWQDGVAAMLATSFLGSCTAQALQSLLLGEVSPSGKLPYTQARYLHDYRSMRAYPKDFEAVTVARLKKGQGDPAVRAVEKLCYTEALMVGYRQFDTEVTEPLYCFGHGLSYSTFCYGHLMVDELSPGKWQLSLTVTNTGSFPASEVVQLYVHALEPVIFRPFQELKGYQKVFLEPNAEKEVQFMVDAKAFERWDLNAWKFVSDEGQYELRLGSSSRDIRLTAVVEYKNRKP